MAIQCEMTTGQANKILAIVRSIACANRLMARSQVELGTDYDRQECPFARRHDKLVALLQTYTGGNYCSCEVSDEMDNLHSYL